MPPAVSRASDRLAPIIVYGATGHTGRMVCAELARRRLAFALSGRDAHRLRALAVSRDAVDVRPASVEHPLSLAAAFEGASAVINCAGPFLDTADAVCGAALDAGAHYLDLTAEQSSAAHCFEAFAGSARERGLSVLPAAAFYGGLSDLLATVAMGDWTHADAIEIGIALDSWHPTEGTRLTGRRNTAKRVNVVDGRLTPLPDPPPRREWTFGAPFGVESMIELPFAETITISRHLRTTEVHTYLMAAALNDVRDPDTPAPLVDAQTGHSPQRFRLEVHVRREGVVRQASAMGHDIYFVSAPIVVEAAARLAADRGGDGGAFALGERFDASGFLHAIAGADLLVESG
jgi:hypothetical protein